MKQARCQTRPEHPPGQQSVRRHRIYCLKAPWREVVGIVGDERDDGVDQKAPTIVMWPVLMSNFSDDEVFVGRSLAYVVRSRRTGSSGFVDEIGRAVWSVNPNLPLASVRTLQEVYTRSLARTSFTLVMLAIASAVALGLTAAAALASYVPARQATTVDPVHALRAE